MYRKKNQLLLLIDEWAALHRLAYAADVKSIETYFSGIMLIKAH
jgi:hypothetical protein